MFQEGQGKDEGFFVFPQRCVWEWPCVRAGMGQVPFPCSGALPEVTRLSGPHARSPSQGTSEEAGVG